MLINTNRVNIVEKDIEDWLWENPDEIAAIIYATVDFQWVARQYRLPSGILDLLGIATVNYGPRVQRIPVLVEVKNQTITSSALAQVCRYAHDLQAIIYQDYYDIEAEMPDDPPYITKVVIGPEPVDSQTLHEANALQVYIHTFSINLNLELNGRTRWTRDAHKSISDSILASARSEELAPLKNMVWFNTIPEDDGKPLSFTQENGDCSFAENGDLL